MAADPLADYAAKRDFARTPEPRPQPPAPAGIGAGGRFVVQRHRARRLHYDVRLEIDGVLFSWAVPKGPSLDPSAKHLAVHVEDHPIEYLDFEGVIPPGEYGGGDVIVWDRGTWSPHGTTDPRRAIERGELHVDLFGEKLRGRFVLVRSEGRGRRPARPHAREGWLLFHKRDEHAVPGWDPEDHPRSVRSGRTNDEVAAAPEAQWDSQRAAAVAALDFSRTRSDIAALDALGPDGGEWTFDGVALRVTNLDEVLLPPRSPGDAPVTKRDTIRWYASAAPVLVPYLGERAVSVPRHDDAPDWVTCWGDPAHDTDRTPGQVVADRPATLAWLAERGVVELHARPSTTAARHRPTHAVVEIEPGSSTSWEDTVLLARLYRTALGHLGVSGYPKTTGRGGIEIWVPVGPTADFATTRHWAEALSRAVAAAVPELVSGDGEGADGQGLARLDCTRNAPDRTVVAPYSVRAAPGAPVSMPIRWEELDDPELRADRWTIADAGARILAAGDVFAGALSPGSPLPAL